MPTYCYRCDRCGEEQEAWHTITTPAPDTLGCSCGKKAKRVFSADVEVLVKGRERPMKLDHTCVPIGWERGNTSAAKQEARYSREIQETRNRAHAVDKQAIKNGIRHIAKVPRELHRMRTNQYGKDYYDPSQQSVGELKAKLKSDGLLFKD